MRKCDIFLIASVIILLANFLTRLANQAQILNYFPLDPTNDWASYIAQLHFLKVCGFHNYCPYWFDGFVTFQLVSPGWFFFALPLYYLFGNILHAAFFSLIALFIAGAILVLMLGKRVGLTKTESMAFFAFLFMNANVIGTYIRQGRLTEFFGFVLFFALAFAVLWYKEKKLNAWFISLPVLFAAIILTNQTIAVLASVLIFSLILILNNRKRIVLMLSLFASLLATSFWWRPFAKAFPQTFGAHQESNLTGLLLAVTKTSVYINVGITVVTAALLFLFIYCVLAKKIDRKTMLFFTPIIVLSVLVLFRIISFIPILKLIYADVYFSFFLFFSLVLFFKSGLQSKKIVLVLLIVASIANVFVTAQHTPLFYAHSGAQKDVLALLGRVDDSFLFLNYEDTDVFAKALYSYAPIYYNLSTPSGWHASINYEQYKRLKQTAQYFKERDCENFAGMLADLRATNIVSEGGGCIVLSGCGFTERAREGNACLYKLQPAENPQL